MLRFIRLLSRGKLHPTILTVSISGITFLRAGRSLYISYFRMLMPCCRKFLCLCRFAAGTCISSDSLSSAGCRRRDYTGIPNMRLLGDCRTVTELRITILTIQITGIASFCTGSFFCILILRIPVASRCYFFRLCHLTARTGIRLDSFPTTGCCYCNLSRIPGMFFLCY